MIKIFYGNDRVKAREMIDKLLGKDYEVIEAENLTRGDMDSVFYGTSQRFWLSLCLKIKNAGRCCRII